MKGPARPAPSVPRLGVNRYSPVTNWNDDPFGADVFEPTPQYTYKKQPPPRPPPPKVNIKQLDAPLKPSHFIRKPTVLSSLLTRKTKVTTLSSQTTVANSQSPQTYTNGDIDPNKMFPKCEPKNAQTAALIDLSSPPSSPTFTTRSSSDGLSIDSFGSDATTSTNHHNVLNGGNASQAESGFEDDFDLFLHSRNGISKEDTFDDLAFGDPFSTQPASKPPIMKKPAVNNDLFEIPSYAQNQPQIPSLKGPTIIRAKPARPKPPDNSALLKNTFGSSFPVTMSLNTSAPIQQVCNGLGNNFESKPHSWDEEESKPLSWDEEESKPLSWDEESSPVRESSPPMPSIPPPPPPVDVGDDLTAVWPEEPPAELADPLHQVTEESEQPYAVALFDYFTDHPDDLCFSANSKIKLIRRVDDEWLCGRLRSGTEGLFPANYVEIKIPLPTESLPVPALLATATALYDFDPVQPGDLRFLTGDTIAVMYKINDEWLFGECNSMKGQFPSNYVQINQ